MAVLGASDSKGTFAVAFPEAGEYRVEFSFPREPTREESTQDVRLDYVVTPGGRNSANRANNAPRTTVLSNNFRNTPLLILVPKGGAQFTGTLRSATMDHAPEAERAINEVGVSVKSSRPKGGIK